MRERTPATARRLSKTKDEATLRLIKAYQRVFGEGGAPDRDDKEIVVTDLLDVTGFFRPPNYAEWMARTKTPHGFELHCALHAARAETMRHILGLLNISDEHLIALEKAVRS